MPCDKIILTLILCFSSTRDNRTRSYATVLFCHNTIPGLIYSFHAQINAILLITAAYSQSTVISLRIEKYQNKSPDPPHLL